MATRKTTHTADSPKGGMTAAELIRVLSTVVPDAVPRVRTVSAFHSDGAREFELGHELGHDADNDAPYPHPTIWDASVKWRGTRVITEGHATPFDAAETLALRLLDGGRCACGRIATTNQAGAYANDKTMADGTKWTVAQQAEAGVCVWRRNGRRWENSCRKQGPRASEVAWR